jgi:hypothetical protein
LDQSAAAGATVGRTHLDVPQFTGRGSDIFSRDGMKCVLWSVSIFGIPIALKYYFRWLLNNIRVRSGTRFSFHGAIGDLYAFFFAFAALGVVDQVMETWLESFGPEDERGFAIAMIALSFALATQAIAATINLLWLKWQCESIGATSGVRIACVAPTAGFVVRYLLMIVSAVTIIGWAWVAVWFARWVARHLESEGRAIHFRGTGLQLLWRTVCMVLGSLPIVSIPWTIAWMYRWGFSQIEIEYTGAVHSQETVAHA